MSDKIIFQDLEVTTILGNDVWERKKKMPLRITCEICTSISTAGMTDKINESVHYGQASKRVLTFAESDHKLQSLEAFSESVALECLSVTPRALAVRVFIKKPRALLHAQFAAIEIFRTRDEVFGSLETALVRAESESDEAFAQRVSFAEKEIAVAKNSAGILANEDHIIVKRLSLNTIIGINRWERHYKQVVNIDLTLCCKKLPIPEDNSKLNKVPRYRNYRTVIDAVSELVEQSSYRTVEALVTSVARAAVKTCKVPKVIVRVEKPSALTFAAYTGAEITRTAEDFAVSGVSPRASAGSLASTGGSFSTVPDTARHSAYISLGTNVGDRLGNLHKAVFNLRKNLPKSRLVETSFLYETLPMYVTDQAPFLNAACLVKTELEPLELLEELKRLEFEMGRDFSVIRNGPRVIDFDILFYDEVVIESDVLTIPHALLHERRFQLGPLCDIDRDLMHHRLGKTSGTLFRHLTTHNEVPEDTVQVTPLKARWHTRPNPHEGCILKPLNPKTQSETVFMGILNCTPDSFSDGGDYVSLDAAVEHATKLFNDGADIIDIGGQSTRPGADPVGVEEEIRRIVPVIKRIRKAGIEISISVDTFYADVAAAALDAGADIINDVTGGYSDPKMLPLVAERQCPYILMHMRGDPLTMTSLNDYSEFDGDVIRAVRFEIAQRVRAALDHGIPRWNIIIDPGIGFAKEGGQNFEILRRLPALTAKHIYASAKSKGSNAEEIAEDVGTDVDNQGYVDENLAVELNNYPVLVGCSRKRFIGNVTGKLNAKDRVWGTAATVTSAIQGGASIVRVHDVAEMYDVARVSDSIYRL
ncbi:trifunctional dihydropteroate synthetase [Coemansia sp. RSA 1813]|nr:trifunctional dihydropteroate synthetase [Coemansia sp. RSA 1646]KAJ1773975.1 trifunctional dihydropteroate synthetase [Coemansia sp. RSA 1843]KAJ2092631.1 trifunctional dihydropteroate synthetase [Coemansia sp. RSA 986]KAJ2213391.1 trifunctional dihydropteroate synthetase [Coemansia sp. RSA 487]KAJ2572747.1 trifunctional dihydropteroate synthetase [Coemansia sp. RSA 1813]